jgi:Transmembrane domain of unknown function (DUF3566)
VSPSPSEQVYQSAGAPRVASRPSSGPGADSMSRPLGATTSTVTGTAAGPGSSAPAPAAAGVGTNLGGYQSSRPVAAAVPATVGQGAPRKVRLTVARVDPWSVLKLSFLLSVAMGIGMVTAAVILWEVINSMGVLDQVNKMLQDIAGKETKFDLYSYVGLGRVVSLSTFIAVINIIILMALCTLGAFLYNIAATLVGGFHVTLSDD